MTTPHGLTTNWMTREEVAEKLRVSNETVSRLIKKGKLPAIKVGGQYRIAEDQYSAFIQLNSTAEPLQVSEGQMQESDAKT